MSVIAMIVLSAILVEALVEYGKQIGKAIIGKEWKTAVTQICAIVVSVLLCFVLNADIFLALNIEVAVPYFGIVLTGIFCSRGANYISDFIGKLTETVNKE